MDTRQPYISSRRVSLAASVIICLSIVVGSAAAIAAIVPLS
ncbi:MULTISPECIES: hypothetical protein [unclassified Bosea (in: a-proteobacteria)]|jgi:hypothetical protein|nr:MULTISPECIES: hypothetical protein [unclassified Bosea (in: a-proteobacteria)]SIQ49939.1 hypothetical protein SAMN05880592_103252 [Bosea sp. TND4EK4]